MKYYVIAGEASGDLHGSALIKALRQRDADPSMRIWGGDKMEAEGAVLVKHYKDLAFMGFVEVIRHLPTIVKNIKFCKRDIEEFQPDALILIDYPGFNLRIAKWAADKKFKVFYYISPQLWAWNEKRVEIIRHSVDKLFAILPFEKPFYQKHGIEVEYVGHPLMERITQYKLEHPTPDEEQTIALLPGSRKQEISRVLPEYIKAAEKFPEQSFTLAAAPHIGMDFYRQFDLDRIPGLTIVEGDSYSVLNRSVAAITTSGTATLETALFDVPQMVCYKGNYLSYQLARRLVKVPYISLVNLIVNKPLVRELIQGECNARTIATELDNLLGGSGRREVMEGYAEIREILGQGGAAMQTAKLILEELGVDNVDQ